LFKNSSSGWFSYAAINGTAAPGSLNGNTANSEFGYSLSIQGDIIAIGAPGATLASTEGSVYFTYLDCGSSNYGPACTPCTCVNGTCNSGIAGNGMCSSCSPGWYGVNCDKMCNCTPPPSQECNEGITGDGVCHRCFFSGVYYYDPTCSSVCTCSAVGGVCDYGLHGKGGCLTCNPNYGGPLCTELCPTTCATGSCFQNTTGNGTCGACVADTYTDYCTPCTCQNGTCDAGVTGSGKCLSCLPGFYGQYCETTCSPCFGGNCSQGISGNGVCTCPAGQVLDTNRTCYTPVSPSGGSPPSDISPISGIGTTNFYLIVIVAPIGFVIIVVIIAVLIWKFAKCDCTVNAEKQFSDNEDSVSM